MNEEPVIFFLRCRIASAVFKPTVYAYGAVNIHDFDVSFSMQRFDDGEQSSGSPFRRQRELTPPQMVQSCGLD
jgi:hypothetical protein